MEHALHKIVSFGIMPVFALANAGVALDPSALGAALGSSVTLGTALGLLVGKPLGIAGFSWVAVRAGVASLPRGANSRALSAVAVLGGIGFTMALFIAGLAFPAGSPLAGLLDAAKVGILAASLLTSVAGALLLRRALGDTNEASS